MACRVLKVSESGCNAARSCSLSRRDASDQALTSVLHEIHRDSRGTYGVRRVHAELRLGRHLAVGHGRVERLMRQAGLQGVASPSVAAQLGEQAAGTFPGPRAASVRC